jgi:hypothetical protein
VSAWVTDLVNALAGRKSPQIDLCRQDRGFIVVKQSKERDVFQFLRIAWHGSPRGRGIVSERRYQSQSTKKRAPLPAAISFNNWRATL